MRTTWCILKIEGEGDDEMGKKIMSALGIVSSHPPISRRNRYLSRT